MSGRTAPEAILAHIEVGVVVQDRLSNVLYANAAARRLLGMPEAELLRTSSFDPRWEAVTADGAELRPEHMPVPVSITTGQPVRDFVLGIRTADDRRRRWLQVTAIPTLAADGEVDAVYCTFIDVSQSQIERDLLSSTYEATIRSTAEGIAIHGEDGAILSANPAAERILGLTLAEMQGRHPVSPAWRLLRADGTPMPPEEIPSERTQRTGEPCRDVRFMVHRSNGDLAWLSVNTDPLVGRDDPRPRGVVATFTDITPQVTATLALDEQRALLRRVTDAVPGVLYQHVTHEDGTDAFPFVSAQARDVLGLDAEVMRQSSERFWTRLHPDDGLRVRAAIAAEASARREAAARGLARDLPFDEEFRIAAADGSWRWVRAQSTGRLVDGALVCHGVITDTTERRLLAEQLRASQRQELIGVLVAGIAHNFNNMLAAILPNLDRARQTATGDLRQELADAYDASESAAELVRHLMMLVRRDETRTAEPVDVVTLVHDVMRMCRRTFDQRIAIRTAASLTPLAVMGWRSELQQVILNLCINARDAVETVENPRIDVEVGPAPGGRVAIAVTDNGTGMTEDAQRRVGQPFFTTKAPGKGTGLGLATALGIVREMGGELTWTSAAGRGTTFRLTLPLAAAVPAESAAAAPSKRRFAGQVVLVIDDEPLVRKTLSRLLAGMGLTPVVAASGAEGLALLADRHDVAVALVDLSMPEMSGAEVLARIGALRPGLPVFVVSGWVADPDALGAARGVIQKPFTTKDLTDALAPVLG
jgi:PAS domain S-box-containing protein